MQTCQHSYKVAVHTTCIIYNVQSAVVAAYDKPHVQQGVAPVVLMAATRC